MDIGIPREVRDGEARVGITPVGVRNLATMGHQVFVERGAGERSGFADSAYIEAGADLVYSPEEVYKRSNLIVKVVRPTEAEFALLTENSTLISFLQLMAARPDKVETLLAKQITAIALESIETDDGDLPIIHAMSQIGGRMMPGLAARFLEVGNGGNGVLLSGLPGVPAAEVVIIGAGMFGQETARAFAHAGANVYLLDCQMRPLMQAEQRCAQWQITTMLANPETIAKAIRFADVVVTAASDPGQRAPRLIDTAMLKTMRPRSLIMDVSITQGGCVETSRPTTHREPVFLHDGIIHYCVPNIPAAVARTATHALTNSTWPIIETIATYGPSAAIAHDSMIARGVWTHCGELVQPLIFGDVTHGEAR
jgi:alanine dehydrogenase